jgi:hypothetical protein
MEKKLKDHYLQQMLMLDASSAWWRMQMRKVLTEIAKFESDIFADYSHPYYVELQYKLEYLRKKGNFEAQAYANFRKKVTEIP